MTIKTNLFYKVSHNGNALLQKTKESMLSSLGVTQDEEAEDWFLSCPECFDEPPPAFFLPPPPCPPSMDLSTLGDFLRDGGDDPPDSCPAFMGAREDVPHGQKIPLAAVTITAVIFVVLVTMIACVIYRVRVHKKRPSKSTPAEGAIIYDDLTPSLQPLSRGRHPAPHILWGPPVAVGTTAGRYHPPRYTQTPSIGRLHDTHSKGTLMGVVGEGYELSLSSSEGTPSAPPPSEPLYHTISSASGSGSEKCSSDTHGQFSNVSPRRYPISDSEEDDSSTPFIAGPVDPARIEEINSRSPSHAKYYLSVPLDAFRPLSTSTLASSNEYETLPLRGGLVGTGRPMTPQERGLPPLPSRSERFRMFLPPDRSRGPSSQQVPQSTWQLRRDSSFRGSRPRTPLLNHEVLYENIPPSSNL